MILFPENLLSLFSLVLFFFFLQGGVFFLYFYFRVSRYLGIVTREHLYFSLMSFGQALYSFGAWQLYSAHSFTAGRFWERFQWVAAIFVFVFFIHFSIHYLRVKLSWVRFTVDLPAFFFGAIALFWPPFIGQTPHPKSFELFGRFYQFLESETGFWADLAGIWFAVHILIIFFAWFFYLGKKVKRRFAAVAGLVVFVLAAFHELFVAVGIYHSPYVLEYGFFLFSVAFYFQLFLDFFRIYRINLERSQELGRLHEESRTFINMATHDLKAPLLSIEGFSTILLDENVSLSGEKRRDYLQRISRNAHQLMQRLTELKNFMAIGRMPEEREPISVQEAVEEVVKSHEIALKRFNIVFHIPKDLNPLFFSRRRLQDLLMNLIDNAAKYCEETSEPTLCIEVKALDREILFKIEDNGPGIDPSHQEKIFDLFYRAHSQGSGSGIGLAAVKKIITQAGGRIWVESELGQGCKFFFTLPQG